MFKRYSLCDQIDSVLSPISIQELVEDMRVHFGAVSTWIFAQACHTNLIVAHRLHRVIACHELLTSIDQLVKSSPAL